MVPSPHTWNNGMMEDWNVDFKRKFFIFDGFVKSPFTGHCEERSEEAISGFQAVKVDEIASLRSQ